MRSKLHNKSLLNIAEHLKIIQIWWKSVLDSTLRRPLRKAKVGKKNNYHTGIYKLQRRAFENTLLWFWKRVAVIRNCMLRNGCCFWAEEIFVSRKQTLSGTETVCADTEALEINVLDFETLYDCAESWCFIILPAKFNLRDQSLGIWAFAFDVGLFLNRHLKTFPTIPSIR